MTVRSGSLRGSVLAFPLLPLVALLAGCGGERSIGETGESSAAAVCPGPATVEGIDVSYYQGTIDWDQVKASGKAFAVARISDGSFQDTKFAENWSGIKAAGLVRGAYQYFRTGQSATTQANNVIAKVGLLGAGDLPVLMDVEEPSPSLGPAAYTAAIHTWIDLVTAGTGKAPLIYTGRYYWDDYVKTTDFQSHGLWIAAYTTGCPTPPLAWPGWRFWQYTDSGSVSGISGNVDLDKFNGSLAELQAFANGSGTATDAGSTGNPGDWGAKYVAQSFPLSTTALTMKAGSSVPASITLRNIGAKAWDSNTHLATSNPRDRASAFVASDWLSPTRPSSVSGTVAPGASFEFKFTLHAPLTPGNYHEFFGVVEEGTAWFSDPGQLGPPDNQLEGQFEVTPDPDASAPIPDAGTVSDATTGTGGAQGTDAAPDDGAQGTDAAPGDDGAIAEGGGTGGSGGEGGSAAGAPPEREKADNPVAETAACTCRAGAASGPPRRPGRGWSPWRRAWG